MRLIDADATVNGLDTALASSRVVAGKDTLVNKALDIFENARNFVANMPTIDAVPVVRCEKCKHTFGRKKGFVLCKKGWMPNDGFCSDGERKDGADVQNT